MKKIVAIFLLTLMISSCKKDEKFPSNPDWLNTRISQMETPAYYMGTKIYGYEWNNEYYYLISIPLSSCSMCEFYNYQGSLVEWTNQKEADFQANGKNIKTIWKRDF